MISKDINKNIGRIENYVARLKKIVEKCYECELATCEQCEICWVDVRAIEAVLGNLEALCDMQMSADRDLQRQKQINEEHQKINGELREKIEELEKELIFIKARQVKTMNNVSEEVKAKIYDNFDKIFYDDTDKKEKLQAILDTDEFINKFDCGKYKKSINLVLFLAKEQINSIQKVKDKIEELKDTLKHYNEYSKLNLLEKVNVDLIDARIEVLQKLLQEKDK